MKEQRHLPPDHAYYLTLFKIEGHDTWRTHLSGHKDGFEKSCVKSCVGSIHPKVTEKKVIRIDRITGNIKDL